MDTLTVSGTLQGEAAFVGKGSVEPDLFSDRGLVLANGLCNGGLSGAVGNAGKDNADNAACL